jgi:hypothetical protein
LISPTEDEDEVAAAAAPFFFFDDFGNGDEDEGGRYGRSVNASVLREAVLGAEELAAIGAVSSVLGPSLDFDCCAWGCDWGYTGTGMSEG